jgi:putative addiction module killer protein
MIRYTVYETEEYKRWFEEQTLKSQRQILSRLLKVEGEGHFGHHKFLERYDIWELKFNDGRRIYYVVVPVSKVILLLGGNKNGQDKDIKKATAILGKINQSSSR